MIYLEAFWTRMTVFVFATLPVLLFAVAISPPGGRNLAALMSLASLASGMSIAWYAIGLAEPAQIAKFELGPRLAASALAAAVVALTANIYMYPVLLALSVFAGTLTHFVLTTRSLPSRRPPEATLPSIRRRLTATVTEGAGTLYSPSVVWLMATQSSPHQVAVYSSADRIYRPGGQSISATTNALQAWVAEAPASCRVERMRRAIVLHAIVGVLGLLALSLLGRIASEFLFGGNLTAREGVFLLMGVAFFAVAMNSALGRCVLVPADRMKVVTASTIVGGLVGVPLVIIGARTDGAFGAAVALAISELLVLAVQVPGALAVLRKELAAS